VAPIPRGVEEKGKHPVNMDLNREAQAVRAGKKASSATIPPRMKEGPSTPPKLPKLSPRSSDVVKGPFPAPPSNPPLPM
jgi:hypothetical protein